MRRVARAASVALLLPVLTLPSAAPAQAANTSACPKVTGQLAQLCQLSSGLITTMSTPRLGVTGSGTDGIWHTTSVATLFESSVGENHATVAYNGSRATSPNNNVSTDSKNGSGISQVVYNYSVSGTAAGSTYKRRQVTSQTSYSYGTTASSRYIRPTTEILDLSCKQVGSTPSAFRDCTSGSVEYVARDFAKPETLSISGTTVRASVPLRYTLRPVTRSSTGGLVQGAPTRTLYGTWSYSGSVSSTSSSGTQAWSLSGIGSFKSKVTTTRQANNFKVSSVRVV